jgi:hypothetical protein
MTPSQDLKPTELIPILVKPRGAPRQQLRFFPTCCGCGKIVFNLAEANIAVVGASHHRLRRVGTHEGAALYTESNGHAFVFCWNCDRQQTQFNAPWINALAVFRGLDEPQRHPEPARKGTPR